MPGRQSPVDIPPTAPIHRDGLQLSYGPVPLLLGRDPIAVHVGATSEMAAIIEDEVFDLAQLHVHCPSEHTFGGTHTPMELHLVHQSVTGRIAVVGVVFVEGHQNPALDAFIAALDDEEAPPSIDLRSLVPDDLAYVAYEGSLTTPPYIEDVAWRVLVRPSTLSAEQSSALCAAHEGNARPVQPMGERSFG